MTTSTARCRQLGLILGLSGIVGAVTTQAASSTARPGGGDTEPPDVVSEPPDGVCDVIWSQWNRLYFAQAVFGSLSIVMCLAVIAVLCKPPPAPMRVTLAHPCVRRHPVLRIPSRGPCLHDNVVQSELMCCT